MDMLLYEFSLATESHKAFRKGRGLCNHHSWEMVHQHGYSLGVSVLFESALDEVINILESAPLEAPVSGMARFLGRSFGAGVADQLEPEGPCLICANVQEAEARYLNTFAEHWSSDKLQTAFGKSDGLCLPHLREALRLVPTREAREQLVEIHRAKWAALKDELNQFQLKVAHNYVGEPMGAEADSWKRAVASMTGGEHALPQLTRPKNST
jgi:hypothetical protein